MDARIPDRAVTDPTLDELSDRAFRVWAMALAWSAGQDADGRIPSRALRLLHPEGEGPEAAAELVTAGVWRRIRDGFANVHGQDWQTTASDARALREQNAERARRYRERKKSASRDRHAFEGPDVTQGVTLASRSVGVVDNSETAAAVGASAPSVTRGVTSDADRDDVRLGEARPPEGEGCGEGETVTEVIGGIAEQVPACQTSPALPGAVSAALAAGWEPSDVLAAVRSEVGPNAGPGVVVTVVRGLASRSSPATIRAERDLQQAARAESIRDSLRARLGAAEADRLLAEAADVLNAPRDSLRAAREAETNAQHEHVTHDVTTGRNDR